MEKLILSRLGKPFTDIDAAAAKARTMSAEVGEPYRAVPHPDGGYAVARGEPNTETPKGETSDDVAESSHDATESPNGDYPWPEASDRATSLVNPKLRASIARQAVTGPTPHSAPPAVAPRADAPIKPRDLRPALRSFWKLEALLVTGLVLGLFPGGMLTNVLRIDPEHVAAIAKFGMLPMISLIGATTAATMIGYILYGYYANRYVIRSTVIESHYGIIARKTIRIEVDHIRSVEVNQGLVDRMIDVGQVEVSSAATDDGTITFRGISNPMAIQEEIELRKKYLRRAGRSGGGE